MHNLQHKFLRCTLRAKTKPHAPSPDIEERLSLIQAAMFYHDRKAIDRRNKLGILLKLALADLKEPGATKELSQALRECGVDIKIHSAHKGEIQRVSLVPCLSRSRGRPRPARRACIVLDFWGVLIGRPCSRTHTFRLASSKCSRPIKFTGVHKFEFSKSIS